MDVLSGGILTGFIISIIPGAATVVVIRRTIMSGWFDGFVSGLGTAVGTALYGCLAAFGLSVISDFLIKHALILKLVAGVYLLYLGIQNYFAQPITNPDDYEPVSTHAAFGSTVFLALTSPITVGLFPIWLSAFGVRAHTFFESLILVGGITLGATLFWLLATLLCAALRHALQDKFLSHLNKFFGVILIALGLGSIVLAFIVL